MDRRRCAPYTLPFPYPYPMASKQGAGALTTVAAQEAVKGKKALHSARTPPPGNNVRQLSAKAAADYLPFVRSDRHKGPVAAVVDFVIAGHRLKARRAAAACLRQGQCVGDFRERTAVRLVPVRTFRPHTQCAVQHLCCMACFLLLEVARMGVHPYSACRVCV